MPSFPLHQAAQNGDISGAKVALDDGAAINGFNASGQTALHLAIDNNHPAMVKYLIGNGANVNLKERGGWSPLDTALYHQQKYNDIYVYLTYNAAH